ncbi:MULTISPECIES: 7TM diverse intracellular signaling domain-containing protein [unclassified Polaromonas]|uniref:sensor domain-containing diguanylate cyclase n=1 Tax=unclassified Polaromonas TaxID=2638319 RepID=UPI001E31924A|nr:MULTISPECIES: 7TM diverse intracellular signaling domain-containing protein [unclassified Polaromonas]
MPFLAVCLAGLLLTHVVAVAQETAASPTQTPTQITLQNPDESPAPMAPVPFKAGRGVMGEGEVLVDSSGTLTFEQVRSKFDAGEGQPVRPQRIMPTGGTAVLWYRLALPAVNEPTTLMLTVPHPNMDSVDLYSPVAAAFGGAWRQQRSGDKVPVAQWPVRHLTPAFELSLQAGETRPTYLRVAHNYPISVPWQLSEPDSFHEQSKESHLLLGVYIGLVLLIVVLSVLHAVSWRDGIHLLFAGYVLVVAAGQLALTGLAGEFLWPGSAWWNDSAPVALTLATAALLHLFLRQMVVDRDAPWLTRGLLAMTLIGAGILAAFLVIGNKSSFNLATPYYVGSMAVYLSVAGWYVWRRPMVGVWVLAAMACLTVGSVFPILRTQGLLPLGAATQYGAQIGAALEIPLLLVALYLRSREKRDNQARVGALTRMDPLTGVGNHRVLLQRLESLMLRQQRDPGAGAVMRVRLSNAIEIRQDYGMEAAQSAVVQAGACITSVAQEGDTVGRHRDGDFVLILQGHLTRDQLSGIGQRLIARGLSESPGLPPNTMLQLKVAVAEAPFQMVDATLLLQSLGAVLGELAGRSGTAIRFVNAADTRSAPAPAPVPQRADEAETVTQ